PQIPETLGKRHDRRPDKSINQESEELYGAMGLLISLFISEADFKIRKTQLDHLKSCLSPDMHQYICKRLLRLLWQESPSGRYLVFQAAANTITRVSFVQKKHLMEILEVLIRADNHVDLSEFAMMKLVKDRFSLPGFVKNKMVSDKLLIRQFLEYYCKEIIEDGNIEKVKSYLMQTYNIDLDFAERIRNPDEIFRVLSLLDELDLKAKEAVTQLCQIVLETEWVLEQENSRVLTRLIFNSMHVPAVDLPYRAIS
ncbi:hypothetical protein N9D31_03770, partial [Oligoflexaceae bacterium]|nr:hypothetical protein [Oligoflexaceae bacterium]